ncbi:respiratory nitrate reductase subunit gamma [Bacillus aquiflavi]|uniref:Respiratory nitrate reductase subunit gamma n=1 Tax=Bacillus aquiflavi TaxID=2672567 RepID=A0A6B3VX31_9BACI|nr:respiratory nitrate reductase subunit gamma [Bacillus aquiflavi]MBA4536479.1 respiratory nitrate reductase subunit gamma [Bacillus aquiflavi]NEY80847.1 respiratory nitrate reductase subunit gamma [Bacillus aquiflavi]
MEILQIILWIVYPYFAIAILGMGLVWRFDDDVNYIENPPYSVRASKILKCTVKSLLLLSLFSGISVFIFRSITNEPLLLFYWFVSLVQLNPDMDLIMNISILSRTHLLFLFTFLTMTSLTSYITYLIKPHLYIKNRLIK